MEYSGELNDALEFLTVRVLGSFVYCRAFGLPDLGFKIVTAVNLAKKAFNNLPGDSLANFTPWLFKDTIVQVNFMHSKFMFFCIKKSDSNIFLNPYYHEYDVPLLCSSVLKKGDVFVDVGAHCGLYSLLSAKIVGNNGRVVSIEPNPINALLLKRNIKLNKLTNVRIFFKAASDKHEKIELYYEKEKTAFSSAIKKAPSSFRVDTIKVDEITTSFDTVRILKIDTEGYDSKVIYGAIETLRKTDYVIIEQINKEAKQILEENNFKLYRLTASKNIVCVNRKVSVKLLIKVGVPI